MKYFYNENHIRDRNGRMIKRDFSKFLGYECAICKKGIRSESDGFVFKGIVTRSLITKCLIRKFYELARIIDYSILAYPDQIGKHIEIACCEKCRVR